MSTTPSRPASGPDDEERHPAFGIIRASRIQASPGAVLFQSDILHGEYIRLEVCEATRQRILHRDWVHAQRPVCQISMSLAQFASFVASIGTEGTPCTIMFTSTGTSKSGARPELSLAPRLALTTDEVCSAAGQAYASIQDAFTRYTDAVAGKEPAAARNAALRSLQAAIANAAPNVAYAAQRLTEHAEAVVEKSRADIEAMVAQAANHLNVPMSDAQAQLMPDDSSPLTSSRNQKEGSQ